MSHYHLEILMPPTDDVKAAVTQILAPFDEGLDRDDEDANGHPFWDWWVIGGRWSGEKIVCAFSKERRDAFYAAMTEAKVTVSGIQCGKQTLQPAEQIAKVDAMWREHFPESPIKVCPLFDHYKGDIGDVMKLEHVPDGLTASRVIVAAPNYDGTKLEAVRMTEDEHWNGVSWIKTTWSGKFSDALAEHVKRLDGCADGYRDKCTPATDWLVVTVDYHS